MARRHTLSGFCICMKAFYQYDPAESRRHLPVLEAGIVFACSHRHPRYMACTVVVLCSALFTSSFVEPASLDRCLMAFSLCSESTRFSVITGHNGKVVVYTIIIFACPLLQASSVGDCSHVQIYNIHKGTFWETYKGKILRKRNSSHDPSCAALEFH